MLLGLAKAFFQARILSKEDKLLIRTFFWWGGLVQIFLAFWSPGQEGFRLHVMVPWLMATAVVFISAIPFMRCCIVGGTLLMVCNLTGPIYYSAFIQNNKGYQSLKELRAHMGTGDVFLCAQSGVIENIEVLLPYFFPEVRGGTLAGRLYAFREKSLDPLRQRLTIQGEQGARVFFSDDIFDVNVQSKLETIHRLRPNEIEEFLSGFDIIDEFSLSTGQRIFRAKMKSSSSIPKKL